MGRTWIALSICLANLVADVICMCTTRSWMLESGIIYISTYQLKMIWFSFVFYCVIALLFEIIYVTGRSMYVHIAISVIFILILVQSFSGVTWLIDPKSVFTSLSDNWEKNLNTPRLALIQKQLRCCGFHNAREFPNDLCRDSISQACLPIIIKLYKANVQSVGIFSIVHSMSNVILILLLWFSIRRKRRNRRKRRAKNPITSPF